MHEIRAVDECPAGYISVTDFAARAEVSRSRVAKDLADGNFPLDRACTIPWKGRHGRAICLDSTYLPQYMDLRAPRSSKPKSKPKRTRPKKSVATGKPKKTGRTPGNRKGQFKAVSTPTKPTRTKAPAPEPEPDDLPPHERQDNTSNLVDAPIKLDTGNERSKAYWAIQHTRIKAMREALELQKARNEVLSVGQVTDTLQQILLVIKQTLLAIPGRVAPALSGESSVVKIRDYLDKEIKTSLKELSKTDKYKLKKEYKND